MSSTRVPPASTAAVAAHLGLSRWAVSRALNGRPGVSEATVARVRRALEVSGFEPDPFARGLRGTRTGAIGVGVPSLEPPALPASLMVLDKLFGRGGFHSEILFTGDHSATEEKTLRRLAGRRVEAVVIFGSRLEPDSPGLAALRRRGVPVLLVEPAAAVLPASSGVTVARLDHRGAMDLLVGHLHTLGHRRLDVVGFRSPTPTVATAESPEGFGTPDEPLRIKSLQQACESHGIPWTQGVRLLAPGPGPRADGGLEGLLERGRDLAAAVLRRRGRAEIATAVVAADDATAFGVLGGLRAAGRAVPGDFSLVGCGNHPLAAGGDPALTTVDLRFEQLVAEAAALLLEQLSAPGQIETGVLTVSPRLILRASTAAVPRGVAPHR